MSENTMQQTGQANDEALAFVSDILSVTDGPSAVLEDRDEFVKSLEGKGPEERSQKARERVKALAEAGVDVETQQAERDFLKRVAGLSKGDFNALYNSSARNSANDTANPDGKPVLDLTEEQTGYIELTRLIQERVFPETYVRDGKLVHVQRVRGARVTGKKFDPSTYRSKDITSSILRSLVARHTRTMKVTEKGVGNPLPLPSLCDAVLSESDWNSLPTLNALVDAPFVREDGTICQVLGYDEASGMWLGLPDGYEPVPDVPSAQEVAEARFLILDQVYRDFPFVSEADRANAVASLITPMVRLIFKCPIPFVLVNARTPGTGKTLLIKIAIAAHGGGSWTFPLHDPAEQRKQLTSILMDQASPVVNFDNLPRGATIDSAALASMLTADEWKDRTLGSNNAVALPNDKMWAGTGNNLKTDTDISQRTMLIELDAGMERPDLRDTEEFALKDLEEWLLDDGNRASLTRALLILIRDWAVAGMPRSKHTMRSFRAWANTVGGILKHHGIDGFLENAHRLAEADEEKQQEAIFLQMWLQLLNGEKLTASELITRHRQTIIENSGNFSTMGDDPWQGSFPTKGNGQPFSAVGLGKWLGARKGTFVNGYVLKYHTDSTTSRTVWWPERTPDNLVTIPQQATQESLDI